MYIRLEECVLQWLFLKIFSTSKLVWGRWTAPSWYCVLLSKLLWSLREYEVTPLLCVFMHLCACMCVWGDFYRRANSCLEKANHHTVPSWIQSCCRLIVQHEPNIFFSAFLSRNANAHVRTNTQACTPCCLSEVIQVFHCYKLFPGPIPRTNANQPLPWHRLAFLREKWPNCSPVVRMTDPVCSGLQMSAKCLSNRGFGPFGNPSNQSAAILKRTLCWIQSNVASLIETLTITSSLTSLHTLSPALTGSLKLHFASLGHVFVFPSSSQKD